MMNTTFQTVTHVNKIYLTAVSKMLMIVPITAGLGFGFICGFSIYLFAGIVVLILMLLFARQEKDGTYSYEYDKSFTITDFSINIDGKSYTINQIMTLRPSIAGYKGYYYAVTGVIASGVHNFLTVGMDTGEIYELQFLIENEEQIKNLESFLALVKPKYQ